VPIPHTKSSSVRPVGEPHARAASARRDQRRHRERATAQPRDLAQRALVGLGRELALAGRRAHRLDQRLCGLAHTGRIEPATAADLASSGPSH
jgi:hypothetical protein